MAARKHPANPAKPSEFPILDANALYARETKGDGNCLFNALSDQLYGHQEEHKSLRDATIAHMRVNAEFYRQYMVVKPVRRNPKRKTNKALAPPIDFTFHTEEELQKQFELHVEKMGQPGEWADNMEVSAFASALNVHVRLWQSDFHYTFSPRVYHSVGCSGIDERPVLNIAYHSWEHYSSVRNLGGPHTGPPNIRTNIPPAPSKKRSSVERDAEEESSSLPIRASKRRSPLPAFDSDSTPECSESSSDESDPSQRSQDVSQQDDIPDLPPQKIKLILKLRNTAEESSSAPVSESSSPASDSPALLSASPTPLWESPAPLDSLDALVPLHAPASEIPAPPSPPPPSEASAILTPLEP